MSAPPCQTNGDELFTQRWCAPAFFPALIGDFNRSATEPVTSSHQMGTTIYPPAMLVLVLCLPAVALDFDQQLAEDIKGIVSIIDPNAKAYVSELSNVVLVEPADGDERAARLGAKMGMFTLTSTEEQKSRLQCSAQAGRWA